MAWRYATRTGSDSSTTRSGVGRKRGRFRFGLKHTPKIIDSEAGIPQESAKCAFRNLRVIGNDQPSIGWLIVAKDDVATSLPIDSIAKPTKDFYQLPTG